LAQIGEHDREPGAAGSTKVGKEKFAARHRLRPMSLRLA